MYIIAEEPYVCVCLYARDTMNNRKISFVKCLPEKEGTYREEKKENLH